MQEHKTTGREELVIPLLVLFGHYWRILKHESLKVIFKGLSRLILRIHEFMNSSKGFANTAISTKSSNKLNCQHHHCTTPPYQPLIQRQPSYCHIPDRCTEGRRWILIANVLQLRRRVLGKIGGSGSFAKLDDLPRFI